MVSTNNHLSSQVYNPSGISTRGGPSHDMETSSVPSSSDGLHLLENGDVVDDATIQGLVTRPTTNQTTRYDAYSLSANTNNYAPTVPSFMDKFSSNSQSTSQSLYNRISKLIKTEKKMMKQKQELIKDINSWCNILPNDDCKKLMYHYIKVLETELDSNEKFLKKKDQINVQLLNVNKRERRTNDLKLKRNKMLIKLRDNENKIGDSPITVLTKENLEELECSVEIVEDQFIRSINLGLKNSIVDYVLTLRDTSTKYTENSKLFLDNYYFSSTKLGPNSNLQRLILQNKLNSASVPETSASTSIQTREVSQNFVNKQKYIAISPNRIGKYIDNKYDGENSFNSPREAENNQDSDLEQEARTAIGELPNRVPTLLRVSTQDFNPLNIQADRAPPPTSEFAPSNDITQQDVNQDHGIDASYIINAYSTPGSLAVRPGSGANHEWSS